MLGKGELDVELGALVLCKKVGNVCDVAAAVGTGSVMVTIMVTKLVLVSMRIANCVLLVASVVVPGAGTGAIGVVRRGESRGTVTVCVN